MTLKGHRKFFVVCFVYKTKRVQLFLFEKNVIAALHKAGLKGPAAARETGHLLPTIYSVLRRFKQCGTVENEERSGMPSLLTPRDTRKLSGVVKSDRKRPLQEVANIFNEYRARFLSGQTVQRKLYETKYNSVLCKKHQNLRLRCQKGCHGVN